MTAKEVISIDSDVLGGTPVFAGTRVAIQTLFDYLEVSSLNDFLQGYPSISREQAEVVIGLAGRMLNVFSTQYEGVVQ